MDKCTYQQERLPNWVFCHTPSITSPSCRALGDFAATARAIFDSFQSHGAAWRLGIPNIELTVRLYEGDENGKSCLPRPHLPL